MNLHGYLTVQPVNVFTAFLEGISKATFRIDIAYIEDTYSWYRDMT